MGTTRAGCLAAGCAAVWIPILACGGEPSPATVQPAPVRAAAQEASSPPTPGPASVRPGSEPTTAQPEPDAAVVRAETTERLNRLASSADKDANASNQALRAVLEERLNWLKEWDDAVKALHDAEHVEPSPERQAADWKADLEHVQALLDQSGKDPESLLTEAFRHPSAQVSDALRAAMKEAIDGAANELKDWKDKLDEKVRSETARKGTNPLAALHDARDKIHQRVATLKARNAEREAALAAAQTPEARALARERLVNFEWESRVETKRLQAKEAQLALETRRINLTELDLKRLDAHVVLASRALERMQARYQSSTARRERDLQRAADHEQRRADRADDPLERYRALRAAELLELEARTLKDENALATCPFPALEEQRSLADQADEDFASIKKLLDDGRVSHLDALRLNNDFRRIGPQRDRIIKRELTIASQQLTYYENQLSSVELDLINDSRDDRSGFDHLLETLPESRHAEASALFEEIERKHAQLLNRRRLVLEKLATRAEQTHEEIQRRIRTLDDQYGFIRTHIFWVRDEGPINLETLAQARREAFLVGKALLRLACEACDRARWGQPTLEFVAAACALAILPWPLFRLQKALTARHKPPRSATPAIKVDYKLPTGSGPPEWNGIGKPYVDEP